MFSGIVETKGTLKEVETTDQGLKAWVGTSFSNLKIGESIAVNGVCLSVTQKNGGDFLCDISPETLDCTTFGIQPLNTTVNLERALCMGERNGGHYVTGHVDQKARISQKVSEGEFCRLSFCNIEPAFQRYLIPKGSVAVNGVSLTVNEVRSQEFDVMLIPHTLEHTNFQDLSVRDFVNLEFDWMTKTVARQVQEQMKLLKESE